MRSNELHVIHYVAYNYPELRFLPSSPRLEVLAVVVASLASARPADEEQQGEGEVCYGINCLMGQADGKQSDLKCSAGIRYKNLSKAIAYCDLRQEGCIMT